MNLEPGRIYTINSRKFDGTIRRSWKCEFVSIDSHKVDLIGWFYEAVRHPDLGLIERGTISHERFYFNRWYNYFIFQRPAGTLRNYYINISMPPVIGDETLDFVDLDLDIVIWPNGRYETLDREEFELNRTELGYPDDVTARALATLAELEAVIEKATRSSLADLETLL